jgi:hypothetical protein
MDTKTLYTEYISVSDTTGTVSGSVYIEFEPIEDTQKMDSSTVVFDDGYLEMVSDKIRRGQPVDFWEAIGAIDYQERLRKHRPLSKWKRFLNFFLVHNRHS